MAKNLQNPTSIIITIVLVSLLITFCKSETFSRKLSVNSIRNKRQKLSHLQFYFHDVVSGRNATAVRVAQSNTTNTSPFSFGAVIIMDNLLTVSPDPNSKLVGRAQGMYAFTSQHESGILLMVMNYAFSEGRYNGSNLSIMGRNPALSEMREMPIVGGSGLFRFAQGYAQARTHTFNSTTGYTVVLYDVYVLHY